MVLHLVEGLGGGGGGLRGGDGGFRYEYGGGGGSSGAQNVTNVVYINASGNTSGREGNGQARITPVN